ncbi:MAG TPA: hypothetical protein VGL27_17330 [Negativicutes bacterium]|jgi:hypothetical protein
MQTDEFENESHYGFETENDDTETELLNDAAYNEKLQLIISSCKLKGGFKYVKNLNIEGEISCKLPMIAFDGLSQLKGLTETSIGDLTAVLIALNDKRFANFVKGFYESNRDVRMALYQWGKLQQSRG